MTCQNPACKRMGGRYTKGCDWCWICGLDISGKTSAHYRAGACAGQQFAEAAYLECCASCCPCCQNFYVATVFRYTFMLIMAPFALAWMLCLFGFYVGVVTPFICFYGCVFDRDTWANSYYQRGIFWYWLTYWGMDEEGYANCCLIFTMMLCFFGVIIPLVLLYFTLGLWLSIPILILSAVLLVVGPCLFGVFPLLHYLAEEWFALSISIHEFLLEKLCCCLDDGCISESPCPEEPRVCPANVNLCLSPWTWCDCSSFSNFLDGISRAAIVEGLETIANSVSGFARFVAEGNGDQD